MQLHRSIHTVRPHHGRAALTSFLLHAGATAIGLGSLATTAQAFQGQPVTRSDRNAGLAVRELVEGTSTGVGGAPLITITGEPGTVYALFAGFNAFPALVDAAALFPNVIGPVSAPVSGLDPALFVPDVGTFGTIPASGVQNLNLSFPLPVGLAGLFMDVQMLTQSAAGVLEVSNGQLRQFITAPPAAAAWVAGPDYPGSPANLWADIEQGDVDGDGDNDTVGAGTSGLELWLTTGGAHVNFLPNPFAGPTNATSVELADVNEDGFLDVVGAFFAGQFFRVWVNNGLDPVTNQWLGYTQLPFASLGFVLGPGNPADVEVGDVNNDGLLDVMFACALIPTNGQRNRLFFNTTTAAGTTFAEVTPTNLPLIFDDSEDCEFVDFDLDGDLDIVIANVDGQAPNTPFGQGGDYMLVNQGVGTGVFLAPNPNPIPASIDESLDVVVGDIDADGLPDLFFSNWAISPLPGQFTTPAVARQDRLLLRRFGVGGAPIYVDFSALLPAQATFGTDAEIFDVDFDGDQDIVTALGSLGPGAPVLVPAIANVGRGAPILINPGITPVNLVPFGARVPIPAVNLLDFRDVEQGDWRELGVAGDFGRYFEKDLGCATTGAGAALSTLNHL